MPATTERRTADAIREEAAKLFFERGYNATSLRDVAAAVGLKVGSLYNHIESKEDLLLQIMGGIIDDLLEQARQALAEATGDAVDRLQAVLGAHLRLHTERAQTVFIGNTELRSLSPDAHQKIVDKRREFELFLRGLVEDAGRAGLADLIDVRIHVYSFVAQATHIASWYQPGRGKSLDEILRDYTKLALRELGVSDADERVDRQYAASAHPAA
ncbi:TetR/AcrR family transcriptional regulator [Sinomonas sp. ASV486]|uniref:TetR/AcrR family transcriptional regulator n=1 Tax=Sinomonas puerhi TaxID=3238584 RepID=A0AB39L686_9MICC|nr:TetR/AcrR family transcriptional regulator [Sinomonas sp. ASV486]MDQ4490098.1 TetR/AcrR family transcriptional regulator [Sinomonas sp. ASV486]